MTITEFLTARYDEDEAVARAATPGPWATQTMAPALVYGDPSEGVFVAQTAVESAVSERALDDALYIEHFHPARSLADIAAKRAIAGMHTAEGAECAQCSFHELYEGFNDVSEPWPCLTLRLLAQPFADHADFEPAWRVA